MPKDSIAVQAHDLIVTKQVPVSWLRAVRLKQIDVMAPPTQVAASRGGIVPAGEPVKPMSTHHITVTGNVEFEDYETFSANEHGNFSFRREANLATDDTSHEILRWQQGFGGEERVELEVDGALREDGVLSVTLNTRFYEGATEGTTELEDSEGWNSLVLPGQTSNFSIHLANDEDDWATITGSIGNRPTK